MKHLLILLSTIAWLFTGTLTAQSMECIDYADSLGTDNFPGIYGIDDVTFDYDGSNQIVTLGIYGYLNNGQEGQTYFSVNGSAPVSLVDLGLASSVGGVQVSQTFNEAPYELEVEYLSNSTLGFNARVYRFMGPVESITMTQFESGLVYNCTQTMNVVSDCITDFEGNSGGGYIIQEIIPFSFDGTDQAVDFGYFDYFDWDEFTDIGNTDNTFFSVNGSALIDLTEIIGNTPYSIGDVVVTIDTTALAASYGVPSNMHSGTITFTGEIDFIITQQVESGIKFICTNPNLGNVNCEDLSNANSSDNFPGIYGLEDLSLDYDGSAQMVTLGIYGYLNNAQEGQTFFSVNGSEPASLVDLGFNSTHGGVQVVQDQSGAWIDLETEYLSNSTLGFNGRVYRFYGQIENITIALFESGVVYSCSDSLAIITECVYDFGGQLATPDGPNGYILGTHAFAFDGDEQTVSMGYYDWATWEQQEQESSADKTYFSVNGSDMIALDVILAEQPYDFGGVTVTVDQTPLLGDYNLQLSMTSGTISFTGAIQLIATQQVESGIVFICPGEVAEGDCDDFTSANDPAGTPGIYTVVDDVPLDYDGSVQQISLGIYGFFNNWDTEPSLGQADQTYFTVNGSTAVSLEEIYLNMPMLIGEVTASVDSTSLVGAYDVENWTSGTVIFSGEIDQIVMTQFESGLLFSCKAEVSDSIACGCNIDADFSAINLGSYYSFVSSGTGTEYAWDFGDGSESDLENPSHYYETQGIFEVCMTNYNLTDTCILTLCKDVEVMLNAPGAQIITPDGDGLNDRYELRCNDVTIYDNNGQVVARLSGQDYWDGRSDQGAELPMGQYILQCQLDDSYSKVTIIR